MDGITGDVGGRDALIVDDMISTGVTIVAAVNALLARGASPRITVVATHGLLVGDAGERLRDAGIARLVLSDSVPPAAGLAVPVEIVTAADVIAQAIERVYGS